MSTAEPSGTLVLLRHGESTFNAEPRFTGLLDVPLSAAGMRQCAEAADLLAAAGLRPDQVITTPLRRAWQTAELMADRIWLPDAVRDWRLAERDYGVLTNMAKPDVRRIYGERAYFEWRRTVDGKPPAATPEQVASWGSLARTPLGPLQPGMSESLREVIVRVRPLLADIQGLLAGGATVLVVGHGNSLRALCALIENLGDAEVERLNLPTGQPLVYDPVNPTVGRYLDPQTATLRAAAVAAEGGT